MVSATLYNQILETPTNQFYIKYANGHYKDPVGYVGEDAARMFVTLLEQESIHMKGIYDEVVYMKPLTAENIDKSLREEDTTIHTHTHRLNGNKVWDHDHLTGNYRGAAHSNCNLNYKNPCFLPVHIHNLSGYDSHHLFIKEFGYNKEHVNVISNKEERFISFPTTVDGGMTIRFLDPFKLLSYPIEKSAWSMRKEQFRKSSKYFSGDQLDQIIKKGVYPYKYMDSIKKMGKTMLPG